MDERAKRRDPRRDPHSGEQGAGAGAGACVFVSFFRRKRSGGRCLKDSLRVDQLFAEESAFPCTCETLEKQIQRLRRN